MTSQPGKQTVAIHVLPNVLKGKGNQTMKFGELLEYKMRNILLGKSYTKCGGETIPSSFSKNQNWLYLGSLTLHTVDFLVCSSQGLSKYIKTKLQITCLYHLYLI